MLKYFFSVILILVEQDFTKTNKLKINIYSGITMQSIKHHKWNHFNEEVSADYMPSRLEVNEMQGNYINTC